MMNFIFRSKPTHLYGSMQTIVKFLGRQSTSTFSQPELINSMNSSAELKELMEVYPQLVKDLTQDDVFKDVPEVNKWHAKVLKHNVFNSFRSRGLLIPGAYKVIEDAHNLTPDNIKLANVMAWCYEMVQAHMMIEDDIIDGSKIRRNDVSWFSRKGVGLNAINDSVFLENAAYLILDRYFENHSQYVTFLSLFRQVVVAHVICKTWEMLKKEEVKSNNFTCDFFTMDNYKTISKYRSEYLCFYCTIALAMNLANKCDPQLLGLLKPWLMELGYVASVQNDLRDVFNNLNINGQVGTDIEEGTYTWLIITALQRASKSQKDMILLHYGKKDPKSIAIITDLYAELNLPSVCKDHVEDRLRCIRNGFKRISQGYSSFIAFFGYLDKISSPENWERKQYFWT